MKQFTETNYKQVINSNKTAMVFFTSKGCHLCRKLKPILDKLDEKYSNKADLFVCDIDKEKKISKIFLKEEGVPTAFIIKDNKVFKVNDPKEADENTWYSEKYLSEILESLD